MSKDRPSAGEQAFYWSLLAGLLIGVVVFGLYRQDRLDFGAEAGNKAAAAPPPEMRASLERIRGLLGDGATAGDLVTDSERRQKAAELIDSLLAEHPESAEAHLLRGVWFLGGADLGGDDLDKARASVERSLDLAPDRLDPLLTLGAIHYQARALEEAETVFRRVVELYPQEPAGYHNLGQALWSQGREEEATEVYRKKLEVKRLHTEGTGVSGPGVAGSGAAIAGSETEPEGEAS